MTTRIDVPPLPLPRRTGTAWLRAAMLFVICVLLADAVFGERGVARRAHARREYAGAERALRGLRYENAGLRDEIRRLRTDPATIEAVARQDLGLIRPGEILFVVKPVKP